MVLIDRFSSCYGQDATQGDIYNNDVEPLLDVLYTGVVSTPLFGGWQCVDFSIPTKDCDDIRIRRHFFGEDPHNARQSHPAGHHPPGHACACGQRFCVATLH